MKCIILFLDVYKQKTRQTGIKICTNCYHQKIGDNNKSKPEPLPWKTERALKAMKGESLINFSLINFICSVCKGGCLPLGFSHSLLVFCHSVCTKTLSKYFLVQTPHSINTLSIQYNTIQYNTIQHITTQRNTTQ